MVAVRGHAVIPDGVSNVPVHQGGSYSLMDGAVEVRAHLPHLLETFLLYTIRILVMYTI